jgi:uncharacterized membrane protein YoaK (UPF0700 family)
MERQTTFMLSFVTGFVDVASFIALSGLFTAQMTAYLVLVGATLGQDGNPNNLNRLLTIPIFMLGCSITSLINLSILGTLKVGLRVLLLIDTALLFAFAGIGQYLHLMHAVLNATEILAAGSLGVLAMSMQDASIRLRMPHFVSTTTMTANLTQFSIDVAGYLANTRRLLQPEAKNLQQQRYKRLGFYGAALTGFLAGATSGALLTVVAGLMSVLLPAGLLLVLAALANRYLNLCLFNHMHAYRIQHKSGTAKYSYGSYKMTATDEKEPIE